MRYLIILVSAFLMAIVWTVTADATKLTPPSTSNITCSNVRCGYGMSCVETPGGPICQQQSVTCANVLCAQGSQCVESATGPQCVPNQPSYPTYPNYPTYPQQSCAYGGYYQHGRLICNPAPSWRQPYQDGWNHYYPPRYYPPRPAPRPTPRPEPTPRPTPRPTPIPSPRPPWHPGGPDIVLPENPEPRMCTMEYAPVCAEKPVVCVRSPCPPVRKTFSNSCMAKGEGYTILYRGECQ